MSARLAPLLSREDGMVLAIQMLDELEHTDAADACSIEDQYHAPGVPQRNILLEYLM